MASEKDQVQDALERFEESEEVSSVCREEAEEDIRFSRLGDQWPDNIKKTRQQEGRPCLTINRLPAFIHQVVNDARQNKPSIAVHPVDNGADEDTAQVIGGLIRSIERSSQADIAYDTAIDHAVTGGFGFFRITTDYAHPMSFDMEARIERVPNPFMVHWDVNSTRFDASDWDYAFVSDWLTEDEFKRKYKNAEPVSFEGGHRDHLSYWLEDSKVRVAEYWERDIENKTILQLSDGRVVLEEDWTGEAKAFLGELAELSNGAFDVSKFSDDDLTAGYTELSGTEVLQDRETETYVVKQHFMNMNQILETKEWHGSTIPICPVWGEEVYSEGRRHFRSMIRDAKDPQRMFNFWRSSSTELVALAPRAPWLVEEGAIPKNERPKWETANARSHSYLEYSQGSQKPERQQFAGVPAGSVQEALSASDDMKSIIGIYDSALGARSNETSGKAILARQRESDVSNFHFNDNLNRALQYGGRCLLEVVPGIYSARQSIRILGEDDAERVINLTAEGGPPDPVEEGEKPKLFNIGVGKYDVTIDSGPSYQTQREETREMLVQILQQVPGAAEILGDLVLDVMDFPNHEQAANRLKMLLPDPIKQAEGIPITPPPGAPPGAPGQPPAPPGVAPQGAPPQGF